MIITEFSRKIYKELKKVPAGQLTTYGRLARAALRPGSARAVGNALNRNPFAPEIGCHRVVKSTGEIGGFAHGKEKKIALLKKEGIKIKNDKVIDFKEVLYKF